MSLAIRHIRAMIEIWARKDEPETDDIRQTLHIARLLEEDTSSPIHLRGFAWHLAIETHAAVGWDVPPDLDLTSCRAAAASLSHSASLLIDEIPALNALEVGFKRAFDATKDVACRACDAACYTEYNYLYSLDIPTIIDWILAMRNAGTGREVPPPRERRAA